MPPLGVLVTTSEAPPPGGVPTDTGIAFMVGRADSGPANAAQLVTSIAQFASIYGQRSATNQVLYDAVDTYFRTGGAQAYIGRVTGPGASSAALTLMDAGAHPTLQISAETPGPNGNALFVVVSISSQSFQLTLQDALGNMIAQSPLLANQADAIAWSALAPAITIAAATGTGATTNNPVAIAATPLAGGQDDFSHATLASWQAALALFSARLGPGQVLAPGQTDAMLAGIWAALLSHASTYNRFALLDLDSGPAAVLIAATASVRASLLASYGAAFAPACLVPGLVPGTTRTVSAAAVAAGLCAAVDALGNPNRSPAGAAFPIDYVLDFAWPAAGPYVDADVQTLNDAGINTFQNRYGVLESFGTSALVAPASDPIYWQLNHGRLRMALVADAQAVGEPFVFDQLDGKGIESIFDMWPLLFGSGLHSLDGGLAFLED